MTSVEGGLDVTELYSDCDQRGIQMPINVLMAGKKTPCDGSCITQYVDNWMNSVPSGKWANWMVTLILVTVNINNKCGITKY